MIGVSVVDGHVDIDGSSIVSVGLGRRPNQSTREPIPEVVLGPDRLVAPGLVDLQVNGGFGIDLTSEPERLWELADLLPATGVTGFLPTIITAAAEIYDRAVAAMADRPTGHAGAEPLGLHFEGPMLAPEHKGAHAEELLRAPDPSLYAGWRRDAGVALVTLAPELPGATAAIRALTASGVVVSGGHTAADGEETIAATEAGMTMVTHLFNAMTSLGHRTPNLVGRALTDDSLTVGLIADGVHVDPAVVDLAFRATGSNRLALVTDAVAAMGQPHGTYGLGRRAVVSGPDGVRRADGTLAGSSLTMDRAVVNLITFTGCEPGEALSAASATPARVLGDETRGRIAAGCRADLVVLGIGPDGDIRPEPVATVIEGRPVTGSLPEPDRV